MNYIIKTAVIGDYGVGKTSIVSRYINNSFNETEYTTLGVDFLHKIVDFKENRYKLQIWDTAGQEKFESIVKNYIRNLDVCILVFDVNCYKSFKKLERWIYLVNLSENKKIYIYLVGNKTDLNLEKVPQEEINKFCKEYNLEYMECSAKNSDYINIIFLNIIDKIDVMVKKNEIKLKPFNEIVDYKEPEKKCCIIS